MSEISIDPLLCLRQMYISAFSGQNKVTKMCLKYLLTPCCNDPLSSLLNNIQNYHVYTMYVNMNMVCTRIVCAMYTDSFGGT